MSKLKNIKLINYCGYRNFELDLSDKEEGIRKWTMFYGPNGSFKSTFLKAVDLLSNPQRFFSKRNILTFRKLKHHKDYSYGVENFYDKMSELKMEATFLVNGLEKKVVLEDNISGIIYAARDVDVEKGEFSGIRINELSPEDQGVIFIDADHGNMMQKFQIISDLSVPFCDFASSVYGFKCYCPDSSKVIDSGIEYCTDFIIIKPDRDNKEYETKIHYKRMSDGEKKIATLVSSLFKRCYEGNPDNEKKSIVIVDNIELHIYFKRHMTLIKKIDEYFPNNQFIVTTHSPVIISEMDKNYLLDMEVNL